MGTIAKVLSLLIAAALVCIAADSGRRKLIAPRPASTSAVLSDTLKTNLVIWLDIAQEVGTNGNGVSMVTDRSPRGTNHFYMTEAGKQPTYTNASAGPNLKASVRFDNVDDSLTNYNIKFGDVTIGYAHTIYAVVNAWTDASGQPTLYGLKTAPANNWSLRRFPFGGTNSWTAYSYSPNDYVSYSVTHPANTNFVIVTMRANVNDTTFFINNTNVASTTQEIADAAAVVALGYYTEAAIGWGGEMAELLWYAEQSDLTKMTNVWKYLNTKYGFGLTIP